MSTTTLTLTMDDLKSEEAGQYSWHSARNPLPVPSRIPTSYDSAQHASAYVLPYHGPPTSSSSGYRPLPAHHQQSAQISSFSSSRELPTASARPPISTHHSFPSLKRSYPAIEDSSSYQDQSDSYESNMDSEKPSINPDHRLLSFGRLPDRSTVLDQQGRPRQLEIAAQIHGMFFLSEIATNSGDGIVIQPELTCYRRNLFQISGTVAGPSGPLSVLNERGQSTQIVSQELSVSAMESVDNHVIRLIVIPWKTPPPNAPEPQVTNDQEPLPIPIFEGVNDQDINSDLTVQPIAWRRLQFRVATANNGRRKELQQHFVLRLTLTATLTDGSKVVTGEATTAPIVVRGRSPRNFQARKEIPLLGSSASSRGHSQQSSPPQRGSSIQERARDAKPKVLELPKRPFQFDASQFPPSPMLHRSSYGQWSTSQHEGYPSTTTPNYPPPMNIPGPYQVTSALSETSTIQNPPILPSFTGADTSRPSFYHASTAPMLQASLSYLDNNPRPTKSPRHALPPDLNAVSGYLTFDHRMGSTSTYQVPVSSSHTNEPREYFPHVQQWTSPEQAQGVHHTSMPPPPPQHYTFPGEGQYVKNEHQDTHYTWGNQ